MNSLLPEPDSTMAADEGTLVHDLAGRVLAGESINLELLDNDARSGIKMYVEEVHRVTTVPQVEDYVEAPRVHKLSFGTVDCWYYDAQRGTLYVWDFKYGHKIVEVFENMQMINYTAGIMEKLGLWPHDQDITVQMCVVQPRAFHEDGTIRKWTCKASDLRGYMNWLKNGAEESLDPNAVCRSGSHCLNCDARHVCPAALKAGMAMYEYTCKALPIHLSPEALGVQMAIEERAIESMKTLHTGHKAQVETLRKSGVAVPGYSIESSRGSRVWSVEDSVVERLGADAGRGLVKSLNLKTPLQAISAGVPEEVVLSMSHRTPGKPKLVRDTERRNREVFGILQTEGEQK